MASAESAESASGSRDMAASRTAAAYLRAAVAEIDALFGAGYARDHPELVASLVQAMSIEAAVATGREAHGQTMALAERISREMRETLLALKPRIFG